MKVTATSVSVVMLNDQEASAKESFGWGFYFFTYLDKSM